MRVWINGSVEQIRDRSTVRDALEEMGLGDPRGVAVAVDGEIVQAGRWEEVILSEGQRVEVLRAVQGGAG